MPSYLLQEDGSFLLQENGSKIILDEIAAPSGFTDVARTKANTLSQAGGLPGGSARPVATIGYSWMTWLPTSLGGAFGYYEIGRLGKNGGTIAQITNEAIVNFADFELPRNKVVQHRIRTVRADGQASAWANFPTVTVPLAECVLTLANNARPNEAFACEDMTPYDFTFSSEDDVKIRKIAGRPLPMGFRPVEVGGDSFSRTIFVAGVGENRTNAVQGRALFGVPLALIRDAALPYVALCDADGFTWFTTPKMTSARRSEPGGVYTATIAFAETTSLAVPVITDTPWHF